MRYCAICDRHYPASAEDSVREHYRQNAVAAVDKALADHPGVGIDIEVCQAYPSEAIEHAATRDDLIVVGSGGEGHAAASIVGSVVANVLRRSRCPVVVVPEAKTSTVGMVAVGIDDSASSERALHWAAKEAEMWSSQLIVAHAWEYPYRFTDDAFAHGRDATHVDAAITVDRAVEEARGITSAPIQRRLLEGGAVQSLLDLSREADLLVLGSRGRGAPRSTRTGTVTLGVAAQARCPVVVMPAA